MEMNSDKEKKKEIIRIKQIKRGGRKKDNEQEGG